MLVEESGFNLAYFLYEEDFKSFVEELIEMYEDETDVEPDESIYYHVEPYFSYAEGEPNKMVIQWKGRWYVIEDEEQFLNFLKKTEYWARFEDMYEGEG